MTDSRYVFSRRLCKCLNAVGIIRTNLRCACSSVGYPPNLPLGSQPSKLRVRQHWIALQTDDTVKISPSTDRGFYSDSPTELIALFSAKSSSTTVLSATR